MVRVAPKRGWMADSSAGRAIELTAKLPSAKCVGRMPAESVSHGERREFVVDVKSLEISVGVLGVGNGWDSTAVIKSGSKELDIALVEAKESNLEIVPFVVGGEASLAPNIGGTAVFRAGDGHVVGIAVVVAAIAVVERRNRGHEMRVEGVQPGEQDSGIGFVFPVPQTDAGSVLMHPGIIFDVIGNGVVRDLEIVAAQRSHQAELVGRVDVENEGTETAQTIDGIVHNLRYRRLQAEVAAVCA